MAGETKVPRLLRPKEVSQLTGLERWRVYEALTSGRLPSMKIGRTYRVSEAVLTRWIEEEHAASGEAVEG